MLIECWGDSLDEPEAVDDWIWPGILRPGQITLMTALPKTGKTTLLSHLLVHRQSGTPLLDRPVRAGLTAVLTEEGRGLWNPRRRKTSSARPCVRWATGSKPHVRKTRLRAPAPAVSTTRSNTGCRARCPPGSPTRSGARSTAFPSPPQPGNCVRPAIRLLAPCSTTQIPSRPPPAPAKWLP